MNHNRINKKIIITGIFFLLLSISSNIAFADGENEVTVGPTSVSISQGSGGDGFIGPLQPQQQATGTFTSLFNFMMGFVGIAAFFMITWGGIQYSASAGNPSMLQAAKDKIWGAIFGLILAGFSVVILQTINPDLVKFRLSTPTTKNCNGTLYNDECPK